MKRWLLPAGGWAAMALPFNLVWEVAQLPLYTLAGERIGSIAFAVVHCTLGDGVIAFLGYLVAAVAWRTPEWPTRAPWTGIAALILFSVVFTVWSEWYNVRIAGSWAYAAAMPTIHGIGVSPLLQWILLPMLMLLGWRWRRQRNATPPGDSD